MSTEEFVTYAIMRFALGRGWEVVQYHPPGGQAAFAVRLGGSVVYPDMIAYRNGIIMVAENKALFDESDVRKLRRMMQCKSAICQIKEYVGDCCRNRRIPMADQCEVVCGHGFAGVIPGEPLQDVHLLHVSDNGDVKVILSSEHPWVTELE